MSNLEIYLTKNTDNDQIESEHNFETFKQLYSCVKRLASWFDKAADNCIQVQIKSADYYDSFVFYNVEHALTFLSVSESEVQL